MANVPHTLETLAGFLLPALLRASWQGGVTLLLAWPTARWLSRISPTAACWLWRVACIKLIAALFWAAPLVIALAPNRSPVRLNCASPQA